MQIKLFSFVFISIISFNAFAQKQKKRLNAKRTPTHLKIDGFLNEPIWDIAENASEFIQFEPLNGSNSNFKTEVSVVYNDYAIYIGARLYDKSADSIMKQLSSRDEIGQSDFFGLTIDPFKDGLTGYTFIITPVNVQFDARQSDWEDTSWDAVWVSATSINNEGWVAEIEIPYSELRFPKKDIQEWGINFVRNVQRTREKSFWNFVDAKVGGYLKQAGELNGISAIIPPIRLSITPYVSGYILNQTESNNLDYSIKGGLDLKYGINESYTLDMMLIPDFGQVESDDKVLNISAFETYYDEKRPFFTEGTELFDKGEIFYSRRIGSVKSERQNTDFKLYENEEITSNTNETSIINATKITGRGKNGLGIGILNGMGALSEITIRDTITGKERKKISQPFTNYNVLVFDKSLKNNSYISLTNANYLQPQFNYQSNVSATHMHFETQDGNYAFEGIVGLSYINDTNQLDSTGIKYELGFEKISGNFRFEVQQSLATKTYNQNDMGFLPKTDELETEASIAYNIYNPFWRMLRWYNRIDISQYSLFSTKKYIGTELSFNSFTTFKNYLSVSIHAEGTIGEYHDYYEPRIINRVYIWPGYYALGTYISPDYRKKFVVDTEFGFWRSYDKIHKGMWMSLQPILRINDHLNLNMRAHFSPEKTIGYVDNTDNNDSIFFGFRNDKTLTSSLNINYNFNAEMALSFRARHYWRTINYIDFYTLNVNGSLTQTNDYQTEDNNSNFFNIDLVYTWRFAPGSELSLVWKNSIENSNSEAVFNYYRNMSDLLNFDKQNSVSIRVLYYIDYFKIKQKLK